eukprot:TRINITY_DN56935_c0_g1_i1.p1 TRINITY_DN56935_c0_g1~~TRINITY_DN56935_c0_g1_i1.p1  ORF type:complete len:522 (+),score=58.90 TRINITY_DN56935_c0_g1_i1:68-1567(+)
MLAFSCATPVNCWAGLVSPFTSLVTGRASRATVAPNRQHESCLCWEVSLTSLLERDTQGHRRVVSSTHAVWAPSPRGPTLVRLRLAAHIVKVSGVRGTGPSRNLIFDVEFIDDVVGAICGQWIGPCNKKVVVREVGKDGRSSCSFSNIADHSGNDSMFHLGFSLVLVDKPNVFPVASRRFDIGSRCGKGSFGKVRKVCDKKTGRKDLVMKTVKKHFNAALEVHVMQKLAGTPGFPELVGGFQRGDKMFGIVSQRLHCDLTTVPEHLAGSGSSQRFGIPAVVDIGRQLVRLLLSIHAKGLLHNDLKPANIMVDTADFRSVYLVDFGLTSVWRVAGHHVDQGLHNKDGICVGTPKYCSVDAHVGNTSRRSDMESLCFVLMQLAVGSLPWMNETGAYSLSTNQIVLQKLDHYSCQHYIRWQLRSNPPFVGVLISMLRYCQGLDFAAEPDYELLVRQLDSAFSGRSDFTSDGGVCASTVMNNYGTNYARKPTKLRHYDSAWHF